jgi:alkanesulfonate monooxygenase SsuD/methylene tetrahydromethanopterin reductase-like flavin-dependent oxidoreductase (luciferase family)
MRVGVVILPEHGWPVASRAWREVEDMGFDHAWTFDHLAWRSLADSPWFSAMPLLSAVAVVTKDIRLGTFVASPNFRHPVTLAKEAMTVDVLSQGRFTLGLGAGSDGHDAVVLGQPRWSARERADRFEEFARLTDRLLRERITTSTGAYYSAHEARMIPGCVQRPRIPLAIAASGPRSLRFAAEIADIWITNGDPRTLGLDDDAASLAHVREQARQLSAVCGAIGRPLGEVRRLVDLGRVARGTLSSAAAFADIAGRYAELGFTDAVIHYPRDAGIFAGRRDILSKIATDSLPEVRRINAGKSL